MQPRVMAPKATKKTCYYEVLALSDRKCEATEIKTAYRKLALKLHPDKAQFNGYTADEATGLFQQVQEAYSVLSDVQERAWYDAHREQILRGDDEGGEDPFKTRINLYRYFTSSCYDGFGDNAEGFYAVYADLFKQIDTEEEEWEDADEEFTAMPPFGNSRAEWADVSSFYKLWLDFLSRKAFGHADKWNPRDAENRQVRRAMEAENKKLRQAAKKEFNAEVRQLVRFVQKRDPRVQEHQKNQARECAEKATRELAEKERRQAEEAKGRRERKEAQKNEEEARWQEVQAAKVAAKARGEVVSDAESESDEEVVEYSCEACSKSFKSEKAYENHTNSKKHVQLVAKLRQEMERDLRKEKAAAAAAETAAEASGEEEDDDAPEASEPKAQLFSPPSRVSAPGGGDEEASDENEDSDDDFLARLAATRGAGTKRQASNARGGSSRASAVATDAGETEDGKGGASASADSASEEEADVIQSGADASLAGKRAQKRAQQKTLLLEKSRERDGVKDLVAAIKKAQRADREDTSAEGANAAPAAALAEPSPNAGRDGRASAPDINAGVESTCGVCSKVFSSRSKLFDHLKESGHAAPVGAPLQVQAGGAKGKKKKR